ncbi:hypothetical protein N9B55_01095 [Vicingaceae bacterium]|nr:hypothetical protein [Vicingaceae bacterium]
MVADFASNYVNAMYDSSREYLNSQWDSKILTDQQDFFLQGEFEKGFLIQNSPQILGIWATENQQYEVKLAIGQNGFIYKIMNLTVAFDGLNRPYFIDQLGENLIAFDKNSFKTIEFLYSPKATKNNVLEQKMAYLFEKANKRPKITVLQYLKNYCDVLDFDYRPFLTYDAKTGGIAMSQENILVSANNFPYYPDELVHLYTVDFNPHYWFNEVCATYTGGSVEYLFESHLKKTASQMDSLSFSSLPENKKLDDDTSFKYALGGLFCKLAMKEYGGKKSLLTLLISGKTEEDFHTALKNIFGVDKEDCDSFVRENLEKYKSNDDIGKKVKS